MSLQAVRRLFVQEFTGRYDLVLDDVDFDDNGANFYIVSGQKWLDENFELGLQNSRLVKTVPAGEWFITTDNARVIEEVWLYDSTTNGGWELCRKNRHDLRRRFPGDPSLLQNSATPLFYAPIYLRNMNDNPFPPTIVDNDALGFNSIMIMAPPLRSLELTLFGKFYQPTLVNDQDRNFWTESKPNVLCMAAAREVEHTMRNSQGVADWERSIRSELIGMEYDMIEQSIVGLKGMEG